MPIEIRRFGVGHRRPQGPPGTVGIEGQLIHSGAGGVVSELAFNRSAAIAPHSNPNLTWFIVIEGGGWVQVGDEKARVQAGEAVLLPPDVAHGAWTEGWPMRAVLVEFATGGPVHLPAILEGVAAALPPGSAISGEQREGIARGEGRLAPRPHDPEDPRAGDPEGEPV
jgi:quercetin dioxygenase-like cupin family protein